MTETYSRFAEFDRAQIDPETGEFPMTLASDGEASDGHVLSIEGAEFTSRAQLQISHQNDPTATLGSISGFRRDLQGSPKRLKARGQIELTGDGVTADIRRDIFHMIRNGHLGAVSVRWNPLKATRRTDLPKDHPAHVRADDPSFAKRNGMYFERWEVLEGSVVAIPADRNAIIARAEETDGDVSAFWRSLAADSPEMPESAIPNSVLGKPIEITASVDAKTELPDLLADLARTVNALQAEGLEIGDIQNALEELGGPKEPTPAELQRDISALRAELEALKQGHVQADLPPAFRNVNEIFDLFDHKLANAGKQVSAAVQAAIDKRRGKLTPNGSPRDQLKSEVDSLLAQAAEREQVSATDAQRIQSLIASLEELVADASARAKKAPPQE